MKARKYYKMIYAVISDIHGNYPALKAVVSDAKAKGAEAFLLLGDYIRDTPTLNEVVDTIRTLPNCTAILGNGDIGVISLDKTKPEYCEFEQMLPNFWTYKNLSEQNLNYLKSLPESADKMLSSGKTVHLSHSIPLIHHTPRLGAFHSGDYARKMERSPFTIEEGMRDMQNAAEEYSDEVAAYPGDICLFGHNHLQYLGSVAGKILLNPGSCGMPSDYNIRAPYALMNDAGDMVEIQLHRVEYDVEQTIKAILEFNGFTHAQFWGKLRAAILKTGSDIPMNRFWQHAREIGGGVFPMQNEIWHKTITSFEFDYNWSIDDWRRFGERHDVIHHYDALIDENNDPVHDTLPGRAYMDKWDGQAFIDEMQLSMDKDVLEVGVGTGRLAVKVASNCRKFYGIDISPKTVERAKENLRANGNASIIHGDFMRYPFNRTYDVVYSSLTFMHIKDKGEAINKIARLLKPYGRFVLSIDKNQSEFIDMGNRKIKIYPDNPADICGYIEAAGLVLEKQFETEFAVIFAARKG
jgi:SAM-dependent methyltransferase/predicted phosphodiesterase